MNKAILKAVMELESQLITGVISEKQFQAELDILFEAATDSKTKEFIQKHKDREI